jgi:TIR domain
MRSIFISYRRNDMAVAAGRLERDLEAKLNKGKIPFMMDKFSIFRDVNDIAAGSNYETTIYHAIDDSDVVLVLIGPHWLEMEHGVCRLDNPADLHRREITDSLKLNKKVIPIQVSDARMPENQKLPEGLKQLGFPKLNAFALGDKSWDNDITQLANEIRQVRPKIKQAVNRLQNDEINEWKGFLTANEEVDGIERNLLNLIRLTKQRGVLIFSRGKLYVQFAYYYKGEDFQIVTFEVVSNKYLPDELKLNKSQTDALAKIGFQLNEDGIYSIEEPIHAEGALRSLSERTWHILDTIFEPDTTFQSHTIFLPNSKQIEVKRQWL